MHPDSEFHPPGAMALLALAVACVIALGGCASAPPPVEQLAVAEAAVQRANTNATQQAAPTELAVAVAKLSRARSAAAAGESEQARRLATEATVDAQRAEMRAQNTRATLAAKDSEDAARVLREELNRKTPR